MSRQTTRQNYAAYAKAVYATVFTISSFVLAKFIGYLFGNSELGEENKVDENINTEQNSLGLCRSFQDYCASQGIFPAEKNPIILLGSIGKRGPSSFIFEPVYTNKFTSKDIKKIRKKFASLSMIWLLL